MPSIDDKVVSMSFNNSQFEAGAARSIGTLERLKQALNFTGAGKGLDQISASAGRVDLSHISNSIDGILGKFTALKVAATAAFSMVAIQAAQAGFNVIKSFTLDPVIAGFKEYETGLNSIQTILANTAAAGTNLKDVNGALAELNKYADQTIYKFGDMTRNIGTFTAAGVDLDTAVGSIKGIANLAALSGSSAEQASTAMYQLSQAISAGRVSLQDWNSVVNAGMGGTIFQRSLAQTAVHMGVLDKNAVQLKGAMKNVTIEGKSFRESIMAAPGKQSWLTGDVLTKTLKQLSGDMSAAQLKAEGYTDAEIKAIQTQARQALEAATQIKTLGQLLDTTKEAIGSGWAQTWQIVFGDFGEAKKLFTGLGAAIGGFVQKSANARNKVLKDWKDLGGRTLLIHGLTQLFRDLGLVIAPIKNAFRDIFPKKTGQDLYDLTAKINHFADALLLRLGQKGFLENLRGTFRGFFAVLDIGKQIIGGIIGVFGKLIGALGIGSGGFLKFTASIGDWLVYIDNTLKSGNKLKNFFNNLGSILAKPLEVLKEVGSAVASLFSGLNLGGIAGLAGTLSPIGRILQVVGAAWDTFINKLSGADSVIAPAMQGLVNFVTSIGQAIGNALSSINWDMVLETIKVGLLGGIFLIFRNFFKGANIADLGGGLLGSIKGPFDALTGTLTTMQTQIKAKTLLTIAAAIGILTASVVALSMIDKAKLDNALSGLGVVFVELMAAMAVLQKFSGAAGFLKVPAIAAGLILLASAILILTAAVKVLAGLSWNDLVKGLTGVGVLLASISVASGPLSANAPGMIRAGVGIIAIAVAMKILASAVKDFGSLSWESLAKGMLSVAIALQVIATASNVFPKNMVAIGAGLILVAAGLKILASAIGSLGGMNMATLAKGIGAIAVSLLILANAMRAMPRGMVAQAAGLILVGVALQGISRAIGSLGGMSMAQIAKGMVALGGGLAILAVGMKAMSGSLSGAAALAVAAVGMRLMAPALVMMGKQSWEGIAKGMATLAASMAILGVAGIALGPVAPAILALGVAMLAVGGGLALAGIGIAAIGVGLSAIAASGTAAIAVLVAAITSLLAQAPAWAMQFAASLVAFVTAIGKAAPQMINAFAQILIALSNAVIQAMPKLVQAFGVLIQGILTVLRNNFPQIVATGIAMMIALLNGIKNSIGRITNLAIDIILRFIGAIAGRMGQIVAAGANLLVKFLLGMANNLGKVVAAAGNVIVKFVTAIGSNMGKIAAAATNAAATFIAKLGAGLAKIVKTAGDAIVKFVGAIGQKAGDIVKAAAKAAGDFLDALAKGLLEIVNRAADAVINFVNGIADSIRTHMPEMWNAGFNVAFAIAEGTIAGLASLPGRIASKLVGAVKSGWNAAKSFLGIGSPSKLFMAMGKQVVEGLAVGVGNSKPVVDAMTKTAKHVTKAAKDILSGTAQGKTMYDIGHYIGESFRKGLVGSTDQINQVWKDLNDKLTKTMMTARIARDKEQKKIDELKSKKKVDWDAVREAQKALNANQALLDRSTAGQAQLTKVLTAQKKELLSFRNEYTKRIEEIDAANQALKDATQVRDDALRGYREQYGALPSLELDMKNQLPRYLKSLTNQITSVQTYAATLSQLRNLGIDEATYRKLLSEGPADQQFANQLLAGGRTAVQSLNALDAQLAAVSSSLATTAAYNLYQAGVDSAQGYLDGLKSKQQETLRYMNQLADQIVRTLKKKMKIKSPSEVFAEIGRLSLEGLSKGFNDGAILSGIGTNAVKALTQTIADISDALDDNLEANPLITPVLDLSSIETEAERMNRMLNNVVPITAAASYGQASSISLPTTRPEEASAQATTTFSFEQNNYSPEALSPVEIYRQTRNQLSMARSAIK